MVFSIPLIRSMVAAAIRVNITGAICIPKPSDRQMVRAQGDCCNAILSMSSKGISRSRVGDLNDNLF